MPRCDACQAQLLDYLYDLLEADERLELEAHLAGCADCQAGLARAHDQQDLLALAARLEFPTLTFTPPPEAEEVDEVADAPPAPAPAPAPVSPATLPLPQE